MLHSIILQTENHSIDGVSYIPNDRFRRLRRIRWLTPMPRSFERCHCIDTRDDSRRHQKVGRSSDANRSGCRFRYGRNRIGRDCGDRRNHAHRGSSAGELELASLAAFAAAAACAPPEELIKRRQQTLQIEIVYHVIAIHIANKPPIGVGQTMGGFETRDIGQRREHGCHIRRTGLAVEAEIAVHQIDRRKIRFARRGRHADPVARLLAVNRRCTARK